VNKNKKRKKVKENGKRKKRKIDPIAAPTAALPGGRDHHFGAGALLDDLLGCGEVMLCSKN
jgi:hypothetical protein